MSSNPETPRLPSSTYAGNRPEELPPVSPPSAGFIVQLFLIPALIVMAVVAVWALFGKLADSESDATQLVSELGSSNTHRRWRAAQGLAQLLHNEEVSPPTDREPLARQVLLVNSLTDLLKESLAKTTPTDDDLNHQVFLARTLSALDADEKTLPVLAEACRETHDIEVRKSALMSVAAIAVRHFNAATENGLKDDDSSALGAAIRRPALERPTISDPEVLEQLRRAAQDSEPVVRHLAGFAISNIGGPDALEQLRVMLLDGNRFARANAALGLARNGSTEGVPTLIELLQESLKPFDIASLSGKTESEMRLAENSFQVEQPQVVRNCLRAVSDLWPSIGEEQQLELKMVIGKVASDFFAPDVRIQAEELLRKIEAR